MELVHGRVITLDQAAQLGVLQSAEALIRESDDKPWQALSPADCPTETMAVTKQTDCAPQTNISLHRALSQLHKGELHRTLGLPEGTPIPSDKLDTAKSSTNPHVAHMARFASVLDGFHNKENQ